MAPPSAAAVLLTKLLLWTVHASVQPACRPMAAPPPVPLAAGTHSHAQPACGAGCWRPPDSRHLLQFLNEDCRRHRQQGRQLCDRFVDNQDAEAS